MTKNQNIIQEKQLSIDILPFGIVCADVNMKVIMVNRFIEETFKKSKENIEDQKVETEFPGLLDYLKSIHNAKEIENGDGYYYDKEKYIVQSFPIHDDQFPGYIIIFYPEYLFEGVTNQLASYNNLSSDLQAIFDISYDVIYVTDAKGNTLRVSPACEKLWGYTQEELVGKNVLELEKEGVYTPSITRLVLEKGQKVTSLQQTRTGRRLMVIGTPIKDINGNIIRIVNASRDITEVHQLQNELESTKMMKEGYRRELKALRAEKNAKNKLINRSPLMKNTVALAKRLAEVNSIVLLLGEIGVGKEVVANYIHDQSPRKNEPFISVNCGALPGDFLEQEMFETRKTLPSGEIKNIPGLFDLANGGTLFLDEIGEMPISLQSKLLRFLSEQENLKEGEITRVNTNVRIIAATSRDLVEEVRNGQFRKDLFYRINVVPITIPPLREREEDILPLCLNFVRQFNQEYEFNKALGHDIIDVFLHYDWPGNVRELRNIIERLLVTSDKTIIDTKGIPEHLFKQNGNEKEIMIKRIIPLKQAIELLESELLELAQKEYQSTTQIAKALGVNQSTISRKLQKYMK